MDQAQLDRLQHGDTAAFAELVREHHRALVSLAATLVGRSEAEEVVQNAWVKAHAAIARFEGRSAIRTWLSRIVINEARMQLRSRKREVFLEDQVPEDSGDALDGLFNGSGRWRHPPTDWGSDSPEELLMEEDLSGCLERLFGSMAPQQLAVLEMRDGSGLAFEDICNTLALSSSNARVLLHRARTQVFKLVDHYRETGEC